jgi:hypothetical protein
LYCHRTSSFWFANHHQFIMPSGHNEPVVH